MTRVKDVIGFDGLYTISDEGVVFSLPKRVPVGNNGGFVMRGGKPLKASVQKRSGHLRVWLSDGSGKKHPRLVHRLVAEAFIPNPDNLPMVNHLFGNGADNRVGKLEWATAKRNSEHAFATGLTKVPNQSGSNNSRAKLTEERVRNIRKRYAEQGNCAAVARDLNLDPKHVWDIVHRRLWANLD